VVAKGSIAIDGISLTVVDVGPDRFRVSLIPHTFAVTAMSRKRVGDAVNLETDILAKYVERLLGAKSGGITEAFLREHGF
jgi:riboflavin synthase